MAVSVGLDIGTVAVRAAVIDARRGKPILRRYGDMPLPPGAVSAGEIVDEDAVTEAVGALWKRFKLPKKRVVIGTANQRVIVRQVDVPQMSEGELIEALPFQVQDAIPIPVEEAILDFVPIEEFTTPDGEPMLSILVVAAQRDMVDVLMRVANGAGLTPQAVDLQPFALARAVFGAESGLGEAGPQGIVDIGGSLTQVLLMRAGVVRFVRILPRGGDDFTEALTEGLGITAEEAEELKRRIGVAPEDDLSDTGDDAVARRLLTRQADSFIEEVRGSINYHLTRTTEGPVERIIVAGNGARLPHLANRLGISLGTPVEPARMLDRIEVGRVQLSREELETAQPVLPTSIGLAMWGLS